MTHNLRLCAGALLVTGLLAPAGLAQAVPDTGTSAAAVNSGLGYATLTWQGGRSEQQLGQVVNQSACDLDADGHHDLVAGVAQGYGRDGFADMAATRRSAGFADAFVDLPQWWSSELDAAAGGWACAGDVNDDGYDDVVQLPAASARTVSLNLFGAVRNPAGRLLDNRVRNYQFPVGTTRLAQQAATGAGDLDGDGRGDVVVSQHTASSAARTGNGRLWVLAGVDSPTVPASVRTVAVTPTAPAADLVAVIDGAADGDALGTATPVGDLNGDGIDDLAVAAPSAGKVWLIHGRTPGAEARQLDLANLDPADGRLWVSGAPGLGSSLAAADDVNGDGRPDLLVGAADTVTRTGGVAVVFGAATPSLVTVDASAGTVSDGQGAAGYWIAAAKPGDALGFSVAALGDLDGDGRSDLLLGAPGNGDGAAYVLRGRADTTTQLLAALAAGDGYRIDGTRGAAQPAQRPSRFGYQVAAVGDVDGNGAEDFAIGAPGHSDHASYRYGGLAVALRGELEASVTLAVSRRVGDGGSLITPATSVLAATDLVDLRANLRISTGQGVAGDVRFTVDGAPLDGCAAVAAVPSAPHRGYAFCEQGTALTTFGLHEIGAAHDGVPGRWGTAQAASTRVLVTDTSAVELSVDQAAGTATATVAAVSSSASVEAGHVAFSVAGTPLPGCAEVAVQEGTARCALSEGVDPFGLRADFSGIAVPSLVDPQADVTVLAASSVELQPALTLALSRTSVGYGDALTARLRVEPAPQGPNPYQVAVLVDGRAVASAALPATGNGVALPRTIGVGGHQVVAVLRDGEGVEVSRSAVAPLKVVKATVARPRASAPRFVPGTRPRVKVTVPRLSNGSLPLGTVTVSVGGVTRTVALKAKHRGTVTVRLAKQRRAVTAKVRFVPSHTAQVASPAATSIKLRPRR